MSEGLGREAAVVESAKQRCRGLILQIENLSSSSAIITDSSRRTLLKLALSELNFLSRCSSSSSPPLSFNIGHLEAVLYFLQQPFITGVSRVCKPVPLSIENSKKTCSSSGKGASVDIICTLNRNPVWVIVSDRKSKYISWYKNDKSKGLKCRIDEILSTARSSETLKPRSIILFFSNGISNFILERLRAEFNASELQLGFSGFDINFSDNLEEEWVCVLARNFGKACVLEIVLNNNNIEGVVSSFPFDVKASYAADGRPEIFQKQIKKDFGDSFYSIISRLKSWKSDLKDVEFENVVNFIGDDDLINFDTTALIAVVSGISNGCTEKLLATPENELRQQFKGNYDFVIGQVMSERKKPILTKMSSVMCGKRGIICESVCSEFKELISMCGGFNERLRANQLLDCLFVVPDLPSERMMSLPTTRKLAVKNKIVFGTGDRWHAPTLTANMSFVRAISQTGMSLFTIEHRPRALTGD